MNNDGLETAIHWKEKVINYLFEHGGALLAGVIVLIAGFFVAAWASRTVLRQLAKKEFEPPILMLVDRAVRVVVLLFAALIALATCGVNLLPLVAGVGAIGVGLGLAMQGVLGNLFAGLTIIFTKPFRVGEFIDLLGEEGVVAKIELFTTTLEHPDRSRVIIPNRKIVGEILHNYGNIRQLNLEVKVAYSADLAKAQSTVREVLSASPRVLKDPDAFVGVSTLADSSIIISVKPWTKVADFVIARIELYESILKAFRNQDIAIPLPQREIRILNEPNAA